MLDRSSSLKLSSYVTMRKDHTRLSVVCMLTVGELSAAAPVGYLTS